MSCLATGASSLAGRLNAVVDDGRGRIPSLTYVICTAPRSGSTLLAQGLSATQLAGRPAEYFDVMPQNEQNWLTRLAIRQPAEYLDKVIAEATTANGICGLKIHWHQFEVFEAKLATALEGALGAAPAIPLTELMRLKFGEVRYVWLRRRNKVAQAISYYRARHSGVWWDFKESSAAPAINHPAEFDFALIDHHVALCTDFDRQWETHFRRSGIRPFNLVYEEFSSGYEVTIRDVLRFLGVPGGGAPLPEPRLRRQADDASLEWERRYREMKDAADRGGSRASVNNPNPASDLPAAKPTEVASGRAVVASRTPDPGTVPPFSVIAAAVAAPPAAPAVFARRSLAASEANGPSLDRWLKPADVLYEENFLTPSECEALVQCFERHRDKAGRTADASDFFDGRFIWFSAIPDDERACKSIMQSARRRIAGKVRKFYKEPGELFSDSIQLLKWLPGQSMPPHAEGAARSHRHFASVVFLNDDFIGGHVYFPKRDLIVNPKKGALLAFRGDASHAHGMTEIFEGGTGYTMPAWFTRDARHRDQCEIEDFSAQSPPRCPVMHSAPGLALEPVAADTPAAAIAALTQKHVAPAIMHHAEAGAAPVSPPRLECFALQPTPSALVPASASRQWMDDLPQRYAYRCLPLAIANAYGWEIRAPIGFTAEWNGGPRKEDITLRALDGASSLDHLVCSTFANGIVTFHTNYLFRTSPGWQLLATGPFNNPKHGISPLTGVIETDWLPFPFTMNWLFSEPGTVSFAKDEPFCLIFPVPRGVLESVTPEIRDFEGESDLKRQYNTWRRSRGEFNKQLERGEPEAAQQGWQKFYVRGEMPEAGVKAPDSHQSKLRLPQPVDRRVTAKGG